MLSPKKIEHETTGPGNVNEAKENKTEKKTTDANSKNLSRIEML